MKKQAIRLSKILADWKLKYKHRDRIEEVEILNFWKKEIGQTGFDYTESLRLNNGILYIKIKSASLRANVFYRKESLRKKINDSLGLNILNISIS